MLIGLCSVKGSPGVTTATLAMAARWPVGEARVVEADPAGGDVAARHRLSATPGLVSLAAAARRQSSAGLLAEHSQRLSGDLPRVVPGPVAAEQARAALGVLTSRGVDAIRSAAGPSDAVVLVDVGRLDPSSPALPLVRGAEALLVMARPRADELSHVAAVVNEIPTWTRIPGLVLVGDGYSRVEVERELGVPVMGTLPQDSAGAAVLRGEERGKPPMKSNLGRAGKRLARTLMAHVEPSSPSSSSQPAAEFAAPVSSNGNGVP
ncbi:chromosome partitioning protein [Haloechinothrix salitolerans]|uniref:Chromosome partitioning protein n=1 Tax=Haloechinothrix salitolerans TaxID=926830 RepID=A0ABW2BWN5_9PSEU